MATRPKVLLVSLVALAVVGGVCALVILLDDEAPPGVAAVRYLPAEAGLVQFFDRDSWAERNGVGDIGHDPSEADRNAYADALEGAYHTTPLAESLVQAPGSPIGDVDIDWSASARGDFDHPDRYWEILRIDDAVDLSAVGAELEDAGYEVGTTAGRPTYRAPEVDESADLIDGRIPAELDEVTILEDRQLLVTSGSEDVLEVVDGDRKSFADTEAGPLAQRAAGSEYFQIAGRDGLRCPTPSDTDSDDPKTEKMLTALDDLGRPDAAAVSVEIRDGQETVGAALQFPSSEAARTDAAIRRTYIPLARDPLTYEPLSELIDLEAVRADGSMVVVEFDYRGDEDAATARSLNIAGPGTGLTACTTGAADSAAD